MMAQSRGKFMAGCGWPFYRSAIILAIGCVCAAASGSAQTYVIDVSAISNGSAGNIGNSCSRLGATFGEPAPGFSSGGGFDLSAGFQSIVAAGPGDTLFFDGFEGCKP
jgi:hypothetical protein